MTLRHSKHLGDYLRLLRRIHTLSDTGKGESREAARLREQAEQIGAWLTPAEVAEAARLERQHAATLAAQGTLGE